MARAVTCFLQQLGYGVVFRQGRPQYYLFMCGLCAVCVRLITKESAARDSAFAGGCVNLLGVFFVFRCTNHFGYHHLFFASIFFFFG